MAFFGTMMAGIALAGMVGTVTSSGINAGLSADKIREHIHEIKDRTTNLKAQYDSVIKGGTKFDAQLQSKMADNINTISSLQAKLQVTNDKFTSQKRYIQLAGVLFVLAIFFLLLLKETGLLDDINDLILSPFRKSSPSTSKSQ